MLNRNHSLFAAAAIATISMLSACTRDSKPEITVSVGEQLAARTKPAVVRIANGCVGKVEWRDREDPSHNKVYEVTSVASGSGYFVNSDGYIVTNAHMVERTQNEDQCKSELWENFVRELAADYGENADAVLNNQEVLQVIEANSNPVAYDSIKLVFLPNGNKLPFEVKTAGKPVGEGKDVAVIKVEVTNAPVLQLGNSEQVQLQDHITLLGFPGAGDSDVLDDKSNFVASITDGKVSAKKTTAEGAPVLQVSAPATHGNSGGPVLDDQGKVVGMLTFGGNPVNGQEVSGFAFAVPTSTIQEFVRQSGVQNQTTVVDQYYEEGLQLMWRKDYANAIAKFEAVKQLFPQHSEVDSLIQKSRQEIAMVQK